jgi:hypothetical protein
MRLAPIAASLLLALAACDDDTPSTMIEPSRPLSARLRSTCPALPAGRTAADPYTSPVVEPSPSVQVFMKIYDTNGAPVTQRSFSMQTGQYGSTPAYATNLGWDLTDAAGNPVPTGHYFLFYTVSDTTGKALGSDSACIGVVH